MTPSSYRRGPLSRRLPGGRLPNQEGVLLPAALFLVLAATLVGSGLFVIARSAVLLGAGDGVLAEALAVRGPSSGVLESGDGVGLVGGYHLLGTGAPGVSWRIWSLVWRADAAAIAEGLMGVVEARHVDLVPDGGGATRSMEDVIRLSGPGDGCSDGPDDIPLIWTRGDTAPVGFLGPFELEAWADRAEEEVAGQPADSAVPRLLRVEAGRLDTGVLRGLLVAPGDLELGGDVTVLGLVLVGGDVRMSGDVRVMGAMRVRGRVTLEHRARVDGCRGVVQEELALIPALAEPFPVPGGGFLGRF